MGDPSLGTGLYSWLLPSSQKVEGMSPEQKRMHEQIGGYLGQPGAETGWGMGLRGAYDPYMQLATQQAGQLAQPINWGQVGPAVQQLLAGRGMEVYRPYLERQLQDQLAGVRERYGAGGMGFGTDVMRGEQRAELDFASQLAQLGYQGQMAALPYGMQMSMAPYQQALAAAGMYSGLASQMAQLRGAELAPYMQYAGVYQPPQYYSQPGLAPSLIEAGGMLGAAKLMSV